MHLSVSGSHVSDAAAMCRLASQLNEVSGLGRYRGVDGAPWIPFEEDAFEQDSPALFEVGGVWFDSGSGTTARIGVAHRPNIGLTSDTTSARSRRAAVEAVEAIVGATHPQLALLGWAPAPELNEEGRPTWSSPQALTRQLFAYASQRPTRAAHRNGPPGLALRTYIGPHLASLFDRDLLLSTPGCVREVDSGAVWIDVVDDVVGASWRELMDAWSACMDHLRPADVFSKMEVDEGRKRIEVRRPSANYRKPPKHS